MSPPEVFAPSSADEPRRTVSARRRPGRPAPDTVAVSQALRRILSAAVPVVGLDAVQPHAACGRVLAVDVVSPCDLPPRDVSAMDGYALRAVDAAGSGLPVRGRLVAGEGVRALCPGTAARIFTGAPLPWGADAVVPQELCRLDARGRLHPDAPPLPGAHVRRAGESVRRGATILRSGHRLRPQDAALAASVGVHRLPVARALRVAVVTTGRELVAPGQALGPGEVYDANRSQLQALLGGLGCDVRMQPALGDAAAATERVLAAAAAQADLVVTSGGVGVGEEDHVRGAVERLGEVMLEGVAMKPGKPLLFGRVCGTHVFGLPGNPAALLVGFVLFVRPYILRRLGAAEIAPRPIQARAGFDVDAAPRRRTYLMARLEPAAGGRVVCRIHPDRSSGALVAAAWARGLAVVPRDTRIRRGDVVEFLPFRELLD